MRKGHGQVFDLPDRDVLTPSPAVPGKKKSKSKTLGPSPAQGRAYHGARGVPRLEPSTVDEALDDDDDAEEEAGSEASLAEAKRWLESGTTKSAATSAKCFLKELLREQFKVDYSKLNNQRVKIKRALVTRLKEIIADAEEELSAGARAEAAMAAIEAGAEGDGLRATEEEFSRVLTLVMGDDMPPTRQPATTSSRSYSAACSRRSRTTRRGRSGSHDAAEKETLPSYGTYRQDALDAANAVNALAKVVSRVGLAITPQRKGVSMWVRRCRPATKRRTRSPSRRCSRRSS